MLSSALFWDVTQRIIVIHYRRFGTTSRSHLQGSRFKNLFLDFLPLEDGNYHYTLRFIPTERSTLLPRDECLTHVTCDWVKRGYILQYSTV
jgi:hypothetical protein